MRKTVIAIVGPTAVGKTSLSIQLAKHLGGEIISGDSMQVYRSMDIGTAKITEDEMQGIPHHMIDIKNPDEPFSAGDFQDYVRMYINEITARNHTPIIVGGSGLYIQSVLYDYQFPQQKRDEALTRKYEKIIEEEGIEPLYSRLKWIDPDQAGKIHPNNHRRVIRALEIYETTGLTMTEYQQKQAPKPKYDVILIGLEMERQRLYEQINKRVDQMMEEGLLHEVHTLYNQGFKNSQSMRAIGYKEMIPYIEGSRDLEEAVELLKRNSRRYAKRQFTWFKNKMDVCWYEVTPETLHEKFTIILEDIEGILKKK